MSLDDHLRRNPHRTCRPVAEVLTKSATPASGDNVSDLHSKKTTDLHPGGLGETRNDGPKPRAVIQSACRGSLQKPTKSINGHASSNSCQPEPVRKHRRKTSGVKGDVGTPRDVADDRPCLDKEKPKSRKSDEAERTRSKKTLKHQTPSKGKLHKPLKLSHHSRKKKSSRHTNNDCSSGPCTPKRSELHPRHHLTSTPNQQLRDPKISCSPRTHHNNAQSSPEEVSSPDVTPLRKFKPQKLTAAEKPSGRMKRDLEEPSSSRPLKRCRKEQTLLTETLPDKTSDAETTPSIKPRSETHNPEQPELDESMSSDLSIELSLQEEFQPLYHSLSIQEEDEEDTEEEDLPSFLQQDNKKPSSISEGLCVWCKLRKYPYWPAVVKSVNQKSKKASILFVDGYLCDQKRKRKGFFVSMRTLKPFDCEESEKLAEIAKETYGNAITWSLELISDYRIRIGCGSFTGSLIEYCAADISCPVRRKFSEGTSVLTFPSQEILSEQFHSSDENTEDINLEEHDDLLSKKVLPDRARAARNRANEKLVDFIVNRQKVEKHLLAVIVGQESSQWLRVLRKPTRRVVDVYLEDDEQVDKVYRYLNKVCDSSPHINTCLEKIQSDRISLILDVLLPEAIIHAIAGVHKLSLEKAEEKYRSGPCYSKRERQEFDMIIEQQMKLKEIALQQKHEVRKHPF